MDSTRRTTDLGKMIAHVQRDETSIALMILLPNIVGSTMASLPLSSYYHIQTAINLILSWLLLHLIQCLLLHRVQTVLDSLEGGAPQNSSSVAS